jgi:hypothetical protein
MLLCPVELIAGGVVVQRTEEVDKAMPGGAGFIAKLLQKSFSITGPSLTRPHKLDGWAAVNRLPTKPSEF